LGELEVQHANLRQAEALAEASGDRRRLGRVLAYLTDCLRLTGAQEAAIETGQRALALAQGETDPSLHIPISTYLAQVYYSRDEYRAAADLFRQNLKKLVGPLVYERFGMLQMPSVHLRTCLAWCLEELGEFADAVEAGTEAVALARTVVHPLNLAVACA